MVFVFVDGPLYGHSCSICQNTYGFEGGWLRGGFEGPWSHWVCFDCEDWLDTLKTPNKE